MGFGPNITLKEPIGYFFICEEVVDLSPTLIVEPNLL